MFQQRPMPPMPSRGFPPQRMQMGGQPFLNRAFGSRQTGGFGRVGSFQQFGQQMRPFSSQFGPQAFGGQQFGVQQAMGRGGGIKGLLSRFLPGGGGAVNATGAAQGLQGIASPANLSSMLGNVQKVLGMAQQVTPMVQQYGPLVRNLPAMFKIYSELKSGGSGDSESVSEETSLEADNSAEGTESESDPPKEISSQPVKKSVKEKPPAVKGASAPKLYI
ncbi:MULTISPECIES: VrrA/YqfQ family protein [Bacillaceae]|uniref:VrrA/YqfQ family protein n=1 Tax=Bacillaceae TaxID=186817 RepID=UPI0026CBA494|nr:MULTISPECIES: VrrA/YqfQ family protein [Bacillaceae]